MVTTWMRPSKTSRLKDHMKPTSNSWGICRLERYSFASFVFILSVVGLAVQQQRVSCFQDAQARTHARCMGARSFESALFSLSSFLSYSSLTLPLPSTISPPCFTLSYPFAELTELQVWTLRKKTETTQWKQIALDFMCRFHFFPTSQDCKGTVIHQSSSFTSLLITVYITDSTF